MTLSLLSHLHFTEKKAVVRVATSVIFPSGRLHAHREMCMERTAVEKATTGRTADCQPHGRQVQQVRYSSRDTPHVYRAMLGEYSGAFFVPLQFR